MQFKLIQSLASLGFMTKLYFELRDGLANVFEVLFTKGSYCHE